MLYLESKIINKCLFIVYNPLRETITFIPQFYTDWLIKNKSHTRIIYSVYSTPFYLESGVK